MAYRSLERYGSHGTYGSHTNDINSLSMNRRVHLGFTRFCLNLDGLAPRVAS